MTTIPRTMRAVVIDGPGAPWSIKEVPVKEPQRGEILIKVQACGVCHSDSFLQQGLWGPMSVYPLTPGHEVIGTIVSIGTDEKKWRIGDRVGGGWHGGHDGTCRSCNRGMFQACDNAIVNGATKTGGYAEYCILRAEAAVRVPHDVDPTEYAPILCAGVTVFNGIRKMNIAQGSIVAIQGVGGLGHLAIQYARKMGYRTTALSNRSAKRDFTLQLGANEYVDTSEEDAVAILQKMGGASLIVVTAPNADVPGPLVNGLETLGKLLILGAAGDVQINPIPLVMKGVSVHGWPSGHAIDSEEVINFAEYQGVKCLVEKFSFDQVEEAVGRMQNNQVRFRSVLVME